MKIVWTQPAVEDLHELHAYIARDSELYASGFVARLVSAVEALENHPKVGRVVPEGNDENIRELLYHHYRIIYRVAKDNIEMLSVIHGARDLGARKLQPWRLGDRWARQETWNR